MCISESSSMKFVPELVITIEIPSITRRDGNGRKIKLVPAKIYCDVQNEFT